MLHISCYLDLFFSPLELGGASKLSSLEERRCHEAGVSEGPDQGELGLGSGDQRLDLLLVLPEHPPQQRLVVGDEGGDAGVRVR